MTLRQELGESPAVVERLLSQAGSPLAEAAGVIAERRVDLVVIAARGTSDHAGAYAQYVLGERNGLTVALAAPSLVSLYRHGPRLPAALVVGISQSGRSPDVVSVLEDAKAQGAVTLAFTNDPTSPLAEAARFVVPLAAGVERAVAATKTYVAELTAIAMLSEALAAAAVQRTTTELRTSAPSELSGLPAALVAALGLESRIAQLAHERAGLVRCTVLGRGYQYATAMEWALKLKEIAGVAADAYSAADFEHGPISMIEPGYPIMAVATTGPALAGLAELLERLRAKDADLLVFSDDSAVRALGRGSAALPAAVPEWLAPIVAVLPCQLFAYHLAIASGRDPEAPPNLNKVTLTR
jgi:glucosamine--fructose-6-phosphate aminotransferase (isomerizing)